MNDNNNDESDANDSDTDLDHDDCGYLSAWEFYTQTYDNPQLFDDSHSVGIPRAAAPQQKPMPEETTVSDSPSLPEQSEIESQPLLYRGEQIPTHLFGGDEQQQSTRNYSSDPELSSSSTREYRRGQHIQPHHHYDPQQPFGNHPYPILPSSIESFVASAPPPPPPQDGEHPPSSRRPTAMILNHATRSWSYPTLLAPHQYNLTATTTSEATTAVATSAIASTHTATAPPAFLPFMPSCLQQNSQLTWPQVPPSVVDRTTSSSQQQQQQQQQATRTTSSHELEIDNSRMVSNLVSMQQQHQPEHRDLLRPTGAVPFLPYNHSLPTMMNQWNSTMATAVPLLPPPIFSASARAVMPGHFHPQTRHQQYQYQHQYHEHQNDAMAGDDRVRRNDNASYSIRSGVASPLDRSGALELPPFTQEIVPPPFQHQNLRLLLRPLTPYNYYYRDERANIPQGLTSTADDVPSDTTVDVAFPTFQSRKCTPSCTSIGTLTKLVKDFK
jgi:hypothetical protein